MSLDGNINNGGHLQGDISSGGNLSGQIVGQKGPPGPPGPPGTTDHTKLLNRNAENQHSESSISGLVDDLNSRPSTVISDAEIALLD